MEIKNLIKPNTVFHCNTEEKANELLRKAHDLGYEWKSDRSYLNESYWDTYNKNTCYDIYDGTYQSMKYDKNNNYTIIEYILDKDLEEKSMDRIIDGKDLVNEKIEVYKDGTMKIHKPLGVFIPKVDEWYYYIDDCGGVTCNTWSDWNEDKWRLKHYKLFRTEEECEDYNWFLDQVDKYSYEFSVEEWKNRNISKYYIYYDFGSERLCFDKVFSHKDSGIVYFKSPQNRTDFVNTVGEKRIRKYMFDILD